MKKVLIIAINSKYSHTNIATHYLKNRIHNLCDVQTLDFTINDQIDNILSKITQAHADIACFGCYIWNIEYVLKIAKSLKSVQPNILIAFGGPEVSYNPEEVLKNHDYVSSVMCGEGENSIKQLVNDYTENGHVEPIYNIPVVVDDIPRIADDIIENYDNRVVYFETSRGCPFRCSYCLSCIDKNIKYFDLDNVKKDIKKLLDKNVNQIRFIDRTFNSDRKRALELWSFLVQNRKDTVFHFEICASLLDDKTMDFLKTVPKGVFEFEIGVQSTNRQTLENINRKYNFEYERQIIEELSKNGIVKTHTDLIIGLPYETMDVFKNSFNELYATRPDEIQIGFLKFLKGTDIYEVKDKFKYKYNEFPPFEVLENSFISYDDISYLKKFENTFETLYNSGYFKHTINILESMYNTPYELYEDITNHFDSKKLFDRKVSLDEFFLVLNNMYKENELYNLINQSLTYDYFLKFNGYRDWHFNKYQSDFKDTINTYIEQHRDTLFDNMNNSKIFKDYKFCILDYDFKTNNSTSGMIYYIKK